MQLTRVFARLAVVLLPLFALAAAAHAQQHESHEPSPVQARASLDAAAYADSDHVYVLTPSVSGEVSNPVAGWSAGGSYLVDVVSAASVDIVSTASQNWLEVRHAGTLDASYKPASFGVALNGGVSSEPDYLSWNAGALVSQDLLDDNLTLLLGFNHGRDVAGRSGTPFSVFSRPLDRESIKAGASLVLDKATIGSLLADVVIENGDPSKPYRYVPLFMPGTQVDAGASVDEVADLRVAARPLEQLPKTRNRFAVSGQRIVRGGVWPEVCTPAATPSAGVMPTAALPVNVQAAQPAHPHAELAKGMPARSSGLPSSQLVEQNDAFAAAVAAHQAGDLARAVRGFDALLARYPNGPLSESAEVQRINAMLELDRVRAQQLARDYLARYPRGFAREQAAEIADASP